MTSETSTLLVKAGEETITSAQLAALVDDDDGELTKTELDRVILEKVGIAVSEDILGMIFEECDEDQSGRVTFDELAGYISSIKKPTKADRAKTIFLQTMSSVPFFPLVCFVAGLLTDLILMILTLTGHEYEGNFNFGYLTSVLYLVGFSVYVAMAYDHAIMETVLTERANQKVISWAAAGFKVSSSSTSTSTSKAVDQSVSLTVADLKVTLEEASVFLPFHVLQEVFSRIDDDDSGRITFAEIKDYAAACQKQGKATGLRLHQLVVAKCLGQFDFLVTWLWTIGAILFLIATFGSDLPEQTLFNLNGIGGILYLVAAAFQFRSYYHDINSFLDYGHELNMIILSLVAKSASKQRDIETGNENMVAAAKELFAKIDVFGGGGDGNLNFIELYDALTNEGFVVQLEILHSIFEQADLNDDGLLQLDEFIDYIVNMKTHVTPEKRFWEVVQISKSDFFFLTLILQLVGSALICVANYGNMAEKTGTNLNFLGTMCFFIPILNYLHGQVEEIASGYDAVVYSQTKFKNEFVAAAKKFRR